MNRLHPITQKFQQGICNEKPSTEVVNNVDTLIKNIEEYSLKYEISHDIDGALSLVIITNSNNLISGEITIDGRLYGFLYNDNWHDLIDRFYNKDIVNGEELNEWMHNS